MLNFILSAYILFFNHFTLDTSPSDLILGKWMSSEKNLIVEISKSKNQFIGKIVWFDDSDDKSKPVYERLDFRNPDVNLRNRKVVGLQVMNGLTFNVKNNYWEDGHIYDASSGRQWNASVYLLNSAQLKVRGYWHFEFIGHDLIFDRISS